MVANQKRQEFRIKLLKRVRSSLEKKLENSRDEVAWFEVVERHVLNIRKDRLLFADMQKRMQITRAQLRVSAIGRE
jgi:hypothetical protein